MRKIQFVYISFLFVFSIFTPSCQNQKAKKKQVISQPKKEHPQFEYGFSLQEYNVQHGVVQSGATLSQLLSSFGIGMTEINTADILSKDSLVGLKFIKEGQAFSVFSKKKDTANKASFFVYETSVVDYVVFDFSDSVSVKRVKRPVSSEQKILTGVIVQNSNLTESINQKTKDINITGELAEGIAGIFAWSIDFFKLQPDDAYKVIYEQKYVEGKPYGIGKLKALWFRHKGEVFYAFNYMDTVSKLSGYYDEKGKEAKRMFLMAPVKFSRISSGYSLRRFHPVQGRFKAHLGTDYAAPTGTPIYSTANGTVIAATRSQFNGNYVKVEHNAIYTTQYLHMSRIAEGIHPGVYVKQGQVIGYVGMTGLATGPHVCYRFWKNGKQVDHRAQKFPQSIPMKAESLPAYLTFISPLKTQLDNSAVH